MKLIDRVDIENWAKFYEAKGFFPYLISKLIHFNSLPGSQINVPSGSSVYVGGWDGEVYSAEERPFIPAGKSLWEFGTNSSFKSKADSDYKKRTIDTLGHIASECTFIFVTPLFWKDKDKWCKSKMKEGIWNDVKVYDSVDLELWLDNSFPVANWFAKTLKKAPKEGLLSAEQLWLEWSTGPDRSLTTLTITSGREKEMERLSALLNLNCSIIAVQAKTKSEALAFIIATAKQFFDESTKDRFFSKSIIVDNEDDYRTLYNNYSKTTLNLIPRFEDKSVMNAAVSAGHHVIVPLGAEDDIKISNIIILPTIEKEGQVLGLIEMGFTKEQADRYSKEAGRDINKLKRLLGFSDNKSKWFKTEDIRQIIPALLLGRWNSYNTGDREIIEKLSGKSYDEYLEILSKWKNFEDSPLLQIGGTWRLTSPLDLWHSLTKSLTNRDLQLLAESFLKVFNDDENHDYDSDDIIKISFSFTEPPKYSEWAKEGLTQTLILVSLYGDNLELSKVQSPKIWVDNVIDRLLEQANDKTWVRIRRQLPLIAEASPKSFISALRNSLQNEVPQIMILFNGKKGFFGESSKHTSLLFALENLAWLPEYLFDVTVILLELARLDPGIKMVNKPANSLVEIYKPWHYQTLASFAERMSILKHAMQKEKEQCWILIVNLLPKSSSIGRPTHKMRWRLFDENTTLNYNREEVYLTNVALVEILFEYFDNTDEKLAELIQNTEKLTAYEDGEIIMPFIESASLKIPKNSTKTRDMLRSILNRHRTYPDAHWSVSHNILQRYQKVYDAIEPTDIILKYRWLFDNVFIEFPDGRYKVEGDKNQDLRHYNRVKEKRTEALQILIENIGLQKCIELANTFDNSRIIGQTLSQIIELEEDTLSIFRNLKNADANLTLVYEFITYKVNSNGEKWIFEIFSKLKNEGFTDNQLSELFIPLNSTKSLWDFLEKTNPNIKSIYWNKVQPHFYHNTTKEKITGLRYLLQYKRFISAVNCAYMIRKDLTTLLITEILQRVATEEASEDLILRPHEVGKLLKEIAKRKDLDSKNAINLEWLYLTFLRSSGFAYKPNFLYKEILEKPEFFVDILKWVYWPEDKKYTELEFKELSSENRQKIISNGSEILRSFKIIPGLQSDNSINKDDLDQWIDTVRSLAITADIIKVADMHIGIILAYYPDDQDKLWPADEISEAIERINTNSLKENFSVTLTNKSGFTGRSQFAGGTIEKNKSAKFKNLADLHKYKHRNLSQIFSDISERYLQIGRHHDNQSERDKLEY